MTGRTQATLDRLTQIVIILDQHDVHETHANNSPVQLYSANCT